MLALFTSSCYKACKLNKPRDISKNEEREVLMSIMLLIAFFLLALFTSSCYKACKLNKPRDISKNEEREVLMSIMLLIAFFFVSFIYKLML